MILRGRILKLKNKTTVVPFKAFLPFLLMICTGLATSSIDLYLPALPELTSFFHTTENVLKISVMISPMVSAFTGLCYGSVSDRYGRRLVILICLFVFFIGSLWCAFSDSSTEFLIARLVQALGSTGMGLLTITILSDKFKGITLARYLSIYSILYPISFALAPNIGAFLMLYTSWRGMFYFLSFVGLILLILLYYVLPETLSETCSETQPGISFKQWFFTIWKMLGTKTVFRNMALTNALSVTMNQIFITNAPFIFEEYFHFTKMQYANLLIIPHAFNIIGCMLYSFALKFLSPKTCMNFGRIILLFFVIFSFISLCLSDGLSAWLVITIYCWCSFGLSFLIMTSMGFALSDLQTDKGLGTGIIQFVRNATSSTLVMLAGYLCAGRVTPVFLAMNTCAILILFIITSCYYKLSNLSEE